MAQVGFQIKTTFTIESKKIFVLIGHFLTDLTFEPNLLMDKQKGIKLKIDSIENIYSFDKINSVGILISLQNVDLNFLLTFEEGDKIFVSNSDD